jgi:integrase/recombinase XerD
MNQLRYKMAEELSLMGYSKKTNVAYVSAMKLLLEYNNKMPSDITETDIKKFLIYKRNQNLAPSTMRIYRCAIHFFYTYIVLKDLKIAHVASTMPDVKLPNVLGVSEVEALIKNAYNLKIQTIIMLFYGTGIRLHELISIKLSDIDSPRMNIKILGKGKKERYVPLNDILLKQLRNYWQKYRPREYLFETNDRSKRYSTRSIQHMFKLAKKKTGITKEGGPHMLRHSYATHLIEGGVPLVMIQRLLGYSSVRTTSGYLWIANQTLSDITSPLELINLPKEEDADE